MGRPAGALSPVSEGRMNAQQITLELDSEPIFSPSFPSRSGEKGLLGMNPSRRRAECAGRVFVLADNRQLIRPQNEHRDVMGSVELDVLLHLAELVLAHLEAPILHGGLTELHRYLLINLPRYVHESFGRLDTVPVLTSEQLHEIMDHDGSNPVSRPGHFCHPPSVALLHVRFRGL